MVKLLSVATILLILATKGKVLVNCDVMHADGNSYSSSQLVMLPNTSRTLTSTSCSENWNLSTQHLTTRGTSVGLVTHRVARRIVKPDPTATPSSSSRIRTATKTRKASATAPVAPSTHSRRKLASAP